MSNKVSQSESNAAWLIFRRRLRRSLILSAGLFGIATTVFAGWSEPIRLGAPTALYVVAYAIVFGAMGIVINVWGLLGLHRRQKDVLRVDAEGISRHCYGKPDIDWRWDQLDDVRYEPLRTIVLGCGGQSLPINDAWLAQHPGDLAAVQRGIEPLVERKLAAMAAGPVTVPLAQLAKRLRRSVWGAMALFAALVALTYPDELPAVLILAPFAVLSLFIKTITIGPEEVVRGKRRMAWRDVERITIRRAPTESWELSGPAGRMLLYGGVDFPLVLRHVLRHCPEAIFAYDIGIPRNAYEAALYPMPPGAPAELTCGADDATVQRARTRLDWTQVGVAMPVCALCVAGLLTLVYTLDRREVRAYEQRGVTVSGEVFRNECCYLARYKVDGAEYTAWVPSLDDAPERVRDGMTVALVYLPDAPGGARVVGQEYGSGLSAKAVIIAWLAALAVTIGFSWYAVQERRRRLVSTAVGF